VGDDFDPQADSTTLHKLYGSDVKPAPGQEPPKAPDRDPERPMTDQERADALKKATDLYLPPAIQTEKGKTLSYSGVIPSLFSGYGGSSTVKLDGTSYTTPQWTNEWVTTDLRSYPDPYDSLSPFTKAVMASRAPASATNWSAPVPGSSGANERLIAQHIMDTPGWWDQAMRRVQQGVYERLRAEMDLGRLTAHQQTALALMGTSTPPSSLASGIGRPDLIGGPVPQAPVTNWSDFLTDMTAFLTTAANGLKVILDAGMTPESGGTMYVQDPMGLRGFARLREGKSFSELSPASMSFNQFLAAVHDTAKDMAGRARELQGRIEPELTPEQKREEWKDIADHDAYLMEGDTITFEAKGGPVHVYAIEQSEIPGARLEEIDQNEKYELTPEDIERANDDAVRFNLVDYERSDHDHRGGGNGVMGGNE
jgi:hypothetical protein